MTGMLNRRGYMELAPAVMERARKHKKIFALLSMDMDHMKMINDEYGHLMGDEAICRMGKALRVLEKYGITPVHISGDEFLAYGITETQEEAGRLIRIINDELDQNNYSDPWICAISASIGLYAAIPQKDDTLDVFMTKADRAMYANKNQKKRRRKGD